MELGFRDGDPGSNKIGNIKIMRNLISKIRGLRPYLNGKNYGFETLSPEKVHYIRTFTPDKSEITWCELQTQYDGRPTVIKGKAGMIHIWTTVTKLLGENRNFNKVAYPVVQLFAWMMCTDMSMNSYIHTNIQYHHEYPLV